MSRRKKAVPEIRDNEGMLCYMDDDTERCVGYLMDFRERGVFDASLGKVNVTPEAAKRHNEILDAAMLKGLDENCEVGQGTTFYMCRVQAKDYPDGMVPEGMLGRPAVRTWIGTMVSASVIEGERVVKFTRGGKTFQGTKRRDDDSIQFRRTA